MNLQKVRYRTKLDKNSICYNVNLRTILFPDSFPFEFINKKIFASLIQFLIFFPPKKLIYNDKRSIGDLLHFRTPILPITHSCKLILIRTLYILSINTLFIFQLLLLLNSLRFYPLLKPILRTALRLVFFISLS